MKPTREGVQKALARLLATDRGLKRFGVESHAYRLNPPLTEKEIADVEKLLGVRLPRAYRDFVTLIGDGGAGPGYGVHPLREHLAIGKKRLKSWKEVADPARPFGRPVTTAEARNLGGFSTHGTIALCEMGCGSAYCLVTAGIEQGWVWSFSNDNLYCPAYTHSRQHPPDATADDRLRLNEEFDAALLAPSNTVRLDFWGWYEHWLDQKANERPGLLEAR